MYAYKDSTSPYEQQRESRANQYAQLKQLALANTAAQREQLDAKLEEQARKRTAAQEHESRQAKERASWLAREKQRAAVQEEKQQRRETALAVQRTKASEKAPAHAPRERSAAFRKAQAAADTKRAQLQAPRRAPMPPAHAPATAVPRQQRVGGLTREEKRRKRMAMEMGISYRPSQGARGLAQGSAKTTPAGGRAPAPRKRPMTAREQFIEEERRRKAAKTDESDYESEYESEGDDDVAPSHSALRSEIWRLFGKNRNACVLTNSYVSRDDNSDDDMEAGASDVLQEELRSASAARREDEREEALLEAHRREKLRRANVS